MLTLAAAQAVPFLHREGTPITVGTGLVTLAAGGAAVGVAWSRPSQAWRWPWLVAGALCLLLAIDEALPLAEWVTTGTGVHWWKLYAAPVAIGVLGWLWSLRLATRELTWRSRPVQLLVLGAAAWCGAYGARLIAYANDHGGFAKFDDRVLGHDLITQASFALEATLKLVGATVLLLALVHVRARIRSSQPLGSL